LLLRSPSILLKKTKSRLSSCVFCGRKSFINFAFAVAILKGVEGLLTRLKADDWQKGVPMMLKLCLIVEQFEIAYHNARPSCEEMPACHFLRNVLSTPIHAPQIAFTVTEMK
jgi:hypothetical protein